MNDKEIKQMLMYRDIFYLLKRYNSIPNEEMITKEILEGHINKNSINYLNSLIETIELYQRSFNFIYKQLKLANISLNYDNKEDACNIMADCQDMINLALGITDESYELKNPSSNIKFINKKNEREDNIEIITIDNIGDLETILNTVITRAAKKENKDV